MKSAGLSIAVVTAAAIAAGTLPAAATDGYFQNGYGARQKALAGAGVADGKDATTSSLNPAGLVHVEDQLGISVSVFSPRRSFEATGTFLLPEGETESGSDYFAIPNLAYSMRTPGVGLVDVIGFTVYGNGGITPTIRTAPIRSARSPVPRQAAFSTLRRERVRCAMANSV